MKKQLIEWVDEYSSLSDKMRDIEKALEACGHQKKYGADVVTLLSECRLDHRFSVLSLLEIYDDLASRKAQLQYKVLSDESV